MHCKLLTEPVEGEPEKRRIVGFACGPYTQCSSCKQKIRGQKFLCDYPVKRPADKSPTCDRALCDNCRVRVGANLDYCGPHARLAEKNGAPEMFAASARRDFHTPEREVIKITPRFDGQCWNCSEPHAANQAAKVYWIPRVGSYPARIYCETCGDDRDYDALAASRRKFRLEEE